MELFDRDSLGWSGEQRLAMAAIAAAVIDIEKPKMSKSAHRGEMERDYLSAVRFFDERNQKSTLGWLAAGLGVNQNAIDALRQRMKRRACLNLRRNPVRFAFSKDPVESWAGTDEQSLSDHFTKIMEGRSSEKKESRDLGADPGTPVRSTARYVPRPPVA